MFDAPIANHVSVLKVLLEHARDTGDSVMIVTPSNGGLSAVLLGILTTLIPGEATMSGRTALFYEGGSITVVRARDRSRRGDKDFSIYFMDGSGDEESRLDRMRWEFQCGRVLSIEQGKLTRCE